MTLAIDPAGIDWGSIADWASGLATVAAVVVALLANRISSKELEDAKRDRREAAEDRAAYRRALNASEHDSRAELARKVILSADRESTLGATPAGRGQDDLQVSLRNCSEYPIYEIQIGPAAGLYEVRALATRDSIAPGEKFSFTAQSASYADAQMLTASFLDVRGRGWLVDRFGILRVGNNRIDFIKLHDFETDPFPDDPNR